MLSYWLRHFDATVAHLVWEGWDGDRWLAVKCTDGRAMTWLTSWDTEEDAVEFEQALARVTSAFQLAPTSTLLWSTAKAGK